MGEKSKIPSFELTPCFPPNDILSFIFTQTMSLKARLRSFFPIPTGSVPFRPPTEGGTTIRSGFRQRQPVLISWFLLSCVAGALLDARKSSLASFDDADRKIRLLQELIQDEKDGRPGSADETRKRLRTVGLGRREDRELWEKERAEKEKTEQERRSKMGFWQRHFGREGAEPAVRASFQSSGRESV